MQNSFLANVNVEQVSKGMIQSVEILQNYTKAEKYVIISSIFNCMFNEKLKGSRTISEVMNIVDYIRLDCKRKQIPEFGGAERFIKGEL
jgi:hypothetical protein|tara:strand:+ start:107 stop:373 length:267 start_codon:yes stop_codon:yes gene_type:complete